MSKEFRRTPGGLHGDLGKGSGQNIDARKVYRRPRQWQDAWEEYRDPSIF